MNTLFQQSPYNEAVFEFINVNSSGHLPYHGNTHSLMVAQLLLQSLESVSDEIRDAGCYAGLYHDYNHTGKPDGASDNISRAIEGMKEYVPSKYHQICESVIRNSEYPSGVHTKELNQDDEVGFLSVALRSADHGWQNLFPINVGFLGIYTEQYSESDSREIFQESKSFQDKIRKEFEFLSESHRPELRVMYETCFKSL